MEKLIKYTLLLAITISAVIVAVCQVTMLDNMKETTRRLTLMENHISYIYALPTRFPSSNWNRNDVVSTVNSIRSIERKIDDLKRELEEMKQKDRCDEP